MREIKFRVWDKREKKYFEHFKGARMDYALRFYEANTQVCYPEQYTGYKMQEQEVYFGDLVSNNYKTDMEVLREVVMHKGCIMLKRVKGRSSLSKYIEIDAHGTFNYKIIGNIHER